MKITHYSTVGKRKERIEYYLHYLKKREKENKKNRILQYARM